MRKELDKMEQYIRDHVDKLEDAITQQVKDLIAPLTKKYGKISFYDAMGVSWFNVEKLGSYSEDADNRCFIIHTL